MYDPKFEKGVRQKMEGLEFTPSESVWANIQKAVAGQRRRRGGFYLWRFALPAALLAGVVSVGYFATRPGKTSPAATMSVAPATAKAPAVAPPSQPAAVSANPSAAAESQPTVPDAPEKRAIQAPAVADNPAAAVANNPAAAGSVKQNTTADRYAHGKRHTAGDSGEAFAGAEESLSDATARNAAARNTIAAKTTVTNAAAVPSIAPYLFQPERANQRDAAAIKAAKPSRKNLIALGRLQKTKRPWEAGFTAGGGVSKLNRLNISVATQDQSLSANLYNIATPAAAPSKRYVSDIRPDASFTAGIYLQKPLSRRLSVNIGMNLHYYSTRITIGEPVNTYVPAAASLIAPNVTAASQNSTSFIAGDREVFTNHYYFLELPVNVQYQLNKSNLLPLFIEGGVSLSRLMGSDALFYNAHSGVYYKDPGVLEKTQFNVSSALMVGLPFHGIRVQAGPQVQYGLTPLVNNKNQGDQHFLYAGIRVILIPGRK
ncbi:MAG TPA: outer membrane beta-barrel protein [Puia sp.]